MKLQLSPYKSLLIFCIRTPLQPSSSQGFLEDKENAPFSSHSTLTFLDSYTCGGQFHGMNIDEAVNHKGDTHMLSHKYAKFNFYFTILFHLKEIVLWMIFV